MFKKKQLNKKLKMYKKLISCNSKKKELKKKKKMMEQQLKERK